jgi:hypothetical protein
MTCCNWCQITQSANRSSAALNHLLIDHSVQRERVPVNLPKWQDLIILSLKNLQMKMRNLVSKKSFYPKFWMAKVRHSIVHAELEAPSLAAPLNPGSQFSSSQELTLSSEESPQPSLQCIGRISWLLSGRGNNHPSKWRWRFWWSPRFFGLWSWNKVGSEWIW